MSIQKPTPTVTTTLRPAQPAKKESELHKMGDAIFRHGKWAADHEYISGDRITDSNGHPQECTTAGMSGKTEPQWNEGGITQDGAVVWEDRFGKGL